MSVNIRTIHPAEESELSTLLETAFERPERESRFVQLLAEQHPNFDPGLSLLAEVDGQPAGYTLFLPRELTLRGVKVSLAVATPLGVLPQFRRQGVGRLLTMTGLSALADRGMRGAITIGAPEFFGALGFASAFDLHAVQARPEHLPPADPSAPWRAITGEDLEALKRLQTESYEHTSGTETRLCSPIDWDGQAPGSYSLALGAPGDPRAYLRFRVRRELEIMECCANDSEGVHAILSLVHQLMDEHARPLALLHIPPETRTSTTLLHRGGLLEHSTFDGGCMLAVTDLAGLLSDLTPWWGPILGTESFSIGASGKSYHLGKGPAGPRVTSHRAKHHLEVPSPALPGLLTGQRSARELLFDPVIRHQSELSAEGEALACRLFPRAPAMWTYSPAFELVDT